MAKCVDTLITRKWNVSLEQAIFSQSNICSEHFTSDCYPQSLLMQKQMGFKPKMVLLPGSVPCVLPRDVTSTTKSRARSTCNKTRKIPREFPESAKSPPEDSEKTLTVGSTSDEKGTSDNTKYSHRYHTRDNKQLNKVVENNSCSGVIRKSINGEPELGNQSEAVNNSGLKRKTTFSNNAGCKRKIHADVKSETFDNYENHGTVKFEPFQESVDNAMKQRSEAICEYIAKIVCSNYEILAINSTFSNDAGCKKERHADVKSEIFDNYENHGNIKIEPSQESADNAMKQRNEANIVCSNSEKLDITSTVSNNAGCKKKMHANVKSETFDNYENHVNVKIEPFQEKESADNARKERNEAMCAYIANIVCSDSEKFAINSTFSNNAGCKKKSHANVKSETFDNYENHGNIKIELSQESDDNAMQQRNEAICEYIANIVCSNSELLAINCKSRDNNSQGTDCDTIPVNFGSLDNIVTSYFECEASPSREKPCNISENTKYGEKIVLKSYPCSHFNDKSANDEQKGHYHIYWKVDSVKELKVKQKATSAKNSECKKLNYTSGKPEPQDSNVNHINIKIEPSPEGVDNPNKQCNNVISDDIANLNGRYTEPRDNPESRETDQQSRYSYSTSRDNISTLRGSITNIDNYSRELGLA